MASTSIIYSKVNNDFFLLIKGQWSTRKRGKKINELKGKECINFTHSFKK